MKIVTCFEKHPKNIVGGIHKQMDIICKELLKKNVDIHYVINKKNKNQNKIEIIDGIKVHNLRNSINLSPIKIRKKILNVIYSLDLILFVKYFHKLNFDIYHLWGANNFTGSWAFFSKIIKRKKFVYTTASSVDCIPGGNPDVPNKLFYKIYEYGLKKADAVVVLAEYMKKTLLQNYGIKSIVIKSGHPVPKGPFKKDDPPTILWISRLEEYKRPEMFLKIARNLKDLRVNFLLIGPNEYMKQKIIDFSNKQKNFTFIPGIPSDRDIYYYEKASLLVNTSTFEGFPNTFIQAWLYETPVISLDIDPDCIICKEGLGYHAKGNMSDLINNIEDLIKNPSKLRMIGKKCRKYAIENHDIKKTAEKHYKLYKFLLKMN